MNIGNDDKISSIDSKLIVTSVNRFHSSVVDLRPSRAVHSISNRICSPVYSRISPKVDCRTIHFGYCSPVEKRSLSSFDAIPSEPETDGCASGNPITASPNLDTIDILATGVHSNLHALVSSFVARDKLNRVGSKTPSAILEKSKPSQQKVFPGYSSLAKDYGSSRVKQAAAALDKTSPTSDNEKKIPLEGVGKKSADQIAAGQKITSSSKLPSNDNKIMKRPKKKIVGHATTTTTTTTVQDKKIGVGSKVEPESKLKVKDPKSISAVDFAKNRLQSQNVDGHHHHQYKVKGNNGVSSPSSQLVSEAKLRWERGQPNKSTSLVDPELSLQQQMFEALGISGDKSRRKVTTTTAEKVNENASPSIPHPKLTVTQKQHIKDRSLSPTWQSDGMGNASSPVTPFLTKGSVAERVMLFERAPERSNLDRSLKSTRVRPAAWKTHSASEYISRIQSYKDRDKENREPLSHLFPARPSYQTVRRGLKSKSNIPQFYYPNGKPPSQNEIDTSILKISTTFKQFPDGVKKEDFGAIVKACGLSAYWRVPLFRAVVGEKNDVIAKDVFLTFWKKILCSCNDPASKFMRILTKSNRNYLLPDDFIPLVQDIVESHPGLTFLKEAVEFHSRYIHTVIARIYYCVNRSWSGRITVPEIRKSNFLQIVALLDDEVDINQITEYFSYEHFYVIYCKFWELDKDHDLLIDRNDLSRHNDHAISSRMIDRIFSGSVTRGAIRSEGKMTYTEFVWFLLSEEDKRQATSIEYWFRCMDLDGDGYLSMYELEYFYEEQLHRMESLGIETLPFQDCLCQMLDIVQPKIKDKISLADLKRCKMTPMFFDTFFNLEKYLDHEQRDPFACHRDPDGDHIEVSDWDRYAAEEYELLVAEEGANEPSEDMTFDDMEVDEIEDISPSIDTLSLETLEHDTPIGGNQDTWTRSSGHKKDAVIKSIVKN